MRELWAPGALAHCPDAGRGRLQALVDLHIAARAQRYPGDIEADALRVRRATGGHEDVAALDDLLAGGAAQPETHPVTRAALDRLRVGAEFHVEAVLHERRADRLGHVRVLAGHELRAMLDRKSVV